MTRFEHDGAFYMRASKKAAQRKAEALRKVGYRAEVRRLGKKKKRIFPRMNWIVLRGGRRKGK